MSKNFDDILAKLKTAETKKMSVAVAQDTHVLEAVKVAKERGIVDSILVGDKDEIEKKAAEVGMNLADYEIIDVKDTIEAARTAVSLVHDGKADIYMKGALESRDFLKSVLDKEVGLRTGRPLSHVCVFEIPGIDRLLFLTDVAFMPYPTLEDKKVIIEYTVDVARACGVDCPKVAPLAAVEVVNPKMPVTVEAAELTKMKNESEDLIKSEISSSEESISKLSFQGILLLKQLECPPYSPSLTLIVRILTGYPYDLILIDRMSFRCIVLNYLKYNIFHLIVLQHGIYLQSTHILTITIWLYLSTLHLQDKSGDGTEWIHLQICIIILLPQ